MAPSAVTSKEEPAWRKKAQAIAATATWYRPRSRRGLLGKVVIVRCCPRCGESHQFREAGYRIGPCRARLLIKARKARSK